MYHKRNDLYAFFTVGVTAADNRLSIEAVLYRFRPVFRVETFPNAMVTGKMSTGG